MAPAYHYFVIALDPGAILASYATCEHGLSAKGMAEAEAERLSQVFPGVRYAVAGSYAIYCETSFSFEAQQPEN